MEESVHGFNAIDAYGRNVRVFLDEIESLGDYPAVTAGADLAGHTTDRFCSFYAIMKRKRVVSPPICYTTTRHSRRSSLARFDERMTNIRLSVVTSHLKNHLGTKCSTEQEATERFEVNLEIALRRHKDKCGATKVVIRLLTASSTRTKVCLLYTSPSPRDQRGSRMPSSA